jgi:hypothetical protein
MFKMDVGKGFIFFSVETPKNSKEILALTPHKLPWCFAIYQKWVHAFNLNHPMGLKLPTWITSRMLLVEYKTMEKKIANYLSKMGSIDCNNFHA